MPQHGTTQREAGSNLRPHKGTVSAFKGMDEVTHIGEFQSRITQLAEAKLSVPTELITGSRIPHAEATELVALLKRADILSSDSNSLNGKCWSFSPADQLSRVELGRLNAYRGEITECLREQEERLRRHAPQAGQLLHEIESTVKDRVFTSRSVLNDVGVIAKQATLSRAIKRHVESILRTGQMQQRLTNLLAGRPAMAVEVLEKVQLVLENSQEQIDLALRTLNSGSDAMSKIRRLTEVVPRIVEGLVDNIGVSSPVVGIKKLQLRHFNSASTLLPSDGA